MMAVSIDTSLRTESTDISKHLEAGSAIRFLNLNRAVVIQQRSDDKISKNKNE
jgi:hypothetical protein